MKKKPISMLFASNTAIFLVVVFLLSLLPLLVDSNGIVASVGFCVWLVLTVYSFLYEAKREKDLLEYIQTLSFHTDSTTRDSLLRFPLPLSVASLDGNLIWYNEQFGHAFNTAGKFDIHLNDILKQEVNLDTFFSTKSEGVKVSVDNNHYRVLINMVRSNSNEIVAILYWLDETRYITLKELYDSTRPVVCTIIVDNFDEVMQNTPDNSKTMLVGTIEKKISDWASSTNGILRKIERDKYFLIFDTHYLSRFTESKFTILETVKNINMGNKIPVTISIGIGTEGESLIADDHYAKNAIDMALGRGGDQVVIKNNSKFLYFGGNSKEIEKYTRVKTRVMAFALKQLITQADKVIVMGHTNADLDSFGAAVGMCSAAVGLNKPTYIVLETSNISTNKMVTRFRNTGDYSNILITRDKAEELITPATLLIIVDVYRPSITEAPVLLKKTDTIVVIDHHRKSSEFIENTSLAYHEPSASSTCEMVTELLQYINDGESINQLIAESLYAGIELDTKSFSFKTGIRTFEAAAYLRRKGVDTSNIKLLFQNDKTVYSIRTDIVRNSEIYKGCIAISKTVSNYVDIPSITAAAADELLEIEGIKASFTMCSLNGKTYISGRSIGDINVQVILEHIGGGGHIVVAGAQLDMDFDESTAILKTAIDKYFDDNRKD